VIGIWYDDGFGFSDLDRIMFWAKFSDQNRIRILLKFFGADRAIKYQYPHNTAAHQGRPAGCTTERDGGPEMSGLSYLAVQIQYW